MSGAYGLIADGRGRGDHAGSIASGRCRFRGRSPEGAVSLHMEVFAPGQLVGKIRGKAASVKLKASLGACVSAFSITSGVRGPHTSERAAASGRSRHAPAAPALSWWEHRPAVHRHWKRCSYPCPPAFPWPIVIAQHMPASFTGPLARRLDGLCASEQVTEVTRSRRPCEPGYAYVGRGDGDVIVSQVAGDVAASHRRPLTAGLPLASERRPIGARARWTHVPAPSQS